MNNYSTIFAGTLHFSCITILRPPHAHLYHQKFLASNLHRRSSRAHFWHRSTSEEVGLYDDKKHLNSYFHIVNSRQRRRHWRRWRPRASTETISYKQSHLWSVLQQSIIYTPKCSCEKFAVTYLLSKAIHVSRVIILRVNANPITNSILLYGVNTAIITQLSVTM